MRKNRKLGQPRKKILFHVDGGGCLVCTSHAPPRPRMFKDGRPVTVARHIYEECFGFIPEGVVLRHTCHNARCINPEHLITGTQRENLADASAAGRMHQGEDHPHSKLTDIQVHEIRVSTERGVVLAKRYGVNQSAITKIRRGYAWTHIHREPTQDELDANIQKMRANAKGGG